MNLYQKLKYKFQTLLVKRKLLKGGKFMLCNPLRVIGAQYIEIEDKVFIRDQIWLEAIKDSVNPKIVIKDNAYIGDFAHINAVRKIVLEESVMLANYVFITDHNHNFENVELPIKDQGIQFVDEVTIGENSWIGEKVSILGASVGKHCIIGANSVVTKSIPDYSIAVGSPARVIKTYNFSTQRWEKV